MINDQNIQPGSIALIAGAAGDNAVDNHDYFFNDSTYLYLYNFFTIPQIFVMGLRCAGFSWIF